jgi:hypothetical protein
MSELKVGDQIFHGGLPMQLLYLIASSEDEAWWRVRPLFVAGEDRNERFGPHDVVSHLHTRLAVARA